MSDAPPLRRGDVVIAEVTGPAGSEIRKRRPWVVVSPDVLNDARSTYLLAPLTTGGHPFRFRIPCEFAGRRGHVVLDQLAAAGAQRVSAAVGRISPATLKAALATLREMFEE